MRFVATALLFCMLPAAALASRDTERRIAALTGQAAALKVKGDKDAGLTLARQALALSEKDPGRRAANLFAALDAMTEYLPDTDFEQQHSVYTRLASVAAVAKGPESYPALAATAGRDVLGFVLRKQGATLPIFAASLARAMPLATTEREKAQITGLAMILAQLYDATGQHPKAIETVAIVGRFYDDPPSKPNSSFAPGLMSLALRYADWQDWPKAIAAADKAIAASVAFHGKRTTEITSALRVRGNAFSAVGRFDEAEREYREAAILADLQPDLGITTTALLNLARLYMATGRDGLAVPLLERVAELAKDGPPQSNTRMVALLDRYNVAMRSGDSAGALRYANLARDDADARGFGASQNYVAILLAVCNASIRANDLDVAARTLASAEALLPKVVSPNSSRYADVMYARGRIAMERQDFSGSAREFRAALARWAQTPGADPQQIASAGAMLAQSLARTGDTAGAWRAGRVGADQMTKVLIDRASRTGAGLLDQQSAAVYETTVDAAWNARSIR